jgi:hypothetical protein
MIDEVFEFFVNSVHPWPGFCTFWWETSMAKMSFFNTLNFATYFTWQSAMATVEKQELNKTTLF